MKYYLSLILALLQGIVCLHAQSNFKPGYIINAKNDTVKGFVDYREWIRNPKEFVFKQALNSASEKFSPANANGFGITGAEYYDKAIVQVSTSTVEISHLSHSIDTAYTRDTLFLKLAVNGKNISLYEFTNSMKTHYYILNKNTHMIEELKQYLYYDDETNAVASVNTYSRQLLRAALTYQPDDKKLQLYIQKTNYAEHDLIDIIVKINGGNLTQQVINTSAGSRFFIGAGIRSSRLVFKSAYAAGPFSDGNANNTISPALSGGVDIFLNKNTRKVVVRMEASLALNSFKFAEATSTNSVRYSLDFKQFGASFVPQIIYNFYSTDKLKAFFDVGISTNIFVYNKYNYITTYPEETFARSISTSKYPEFQTFTFSIPVKAGVQVNKHLEIYGTYWLPSSITRYVYYSANLSAFQAGVNYLFK